MPVQMVPLLFPVFLGGTSGKNLPANAGDPGLIPGLGRSPGIGNGNPLWYSCLGNFTDRGTWRATVRGATELDMTEVTYPHIKPSSKSLSFFVTLICHTAGHSPIFLVCFPSPLPQIRCLSSFWTMPPSSRVLT